MFPERDTYSRYLPHERIFFLEVFLERLSSHSNGNLIWLVYEACPLQSRFHFVTCRGREHPFILAGGKRIDAKKNGRGRPQSGGGPAAEPGRVYSPMAVDDPRSPLCWERTSSLRNFELVDWISMCEVQCPINMIFPDGQDLVHTYRFSMSERICTKTSPAPRSCVKVVRVGTKPGKACIISRKRGGIDG